MEHASLLRKHQSRGELSLTMEVEDLSRYESRSSRAYYRALNMLMKLQAVRQKQQQHNSEPEVEEEPAQQSLPQPLLTKEVKPPAHSITADRRSNPIPPGEAPARTRSPTPRDHFALALCAARSLTTEYSPPRQSECHVGTGNPALRRRRQARLRRGTKHNILAPADFIDSRNPLQSRVQLLLPQHHAGCRVKRPHLR